MSESTLTPATFLSRKHETDTIVSFFFQKPEGYEFEAGQATKICLGDGLEDKELAKTMSFCSAPSEEVLQFTMHVDSQSIFKTKMLALEPQDRVLLRHAKGEFTLPPKFEKIYAIAGGVGITPFISMFRELKTTRPENLKNIAFYHVSSSEFIFANEYLDLPLTTAQADFKTMEAQLREHRAHLQKGDSPFYLSGSPRFVMGVRQILQDIGVANERIKLDSFAGYQELLV